ncbi:DUF1542 domain-containing protein [Nocardia otitidiscaviarum]|uniref:DUF1542 domain-containing protein n=1 Tax=Nocardia otitidiscaviarum TaxID=1823 RepID=UPI0018949A19|nr:DUF1542 domain-containing protein [Nocardia otitidiscaviarum]MBF6241274.1 DUF1542 domain-containing protein [Nocardia otitidiscaviarum]
MATVLILLIAMVIVLGVVMVVAQRSRTTTRLADAKADARRVIDRLGGQVYNLTGTDAAAKQALADAGERFNAAGAQIEQARTPAQARLAKETALEGLYYVRAARTAMGLDPGPAIPELDGQRTAGKVSEDRVVDLDGRRIEASPTPSPRTPNYYPGGRVAGRPVPAGWYSEPWWKTALVAGAWGVGSVLLFDALFSGMSGVGYDATAFEQGYGDGFQAGLETGSQGDAGYYDEPGGYDGGYDSGGYDSSGYDGGFGSGGSDGGFGSGGSDGGFDSGGFDSGGFDGGF